MQRIASYRYAAGERGFTLLELLTTLALAALLLTITVPALNSLSARNQQTAEINRFIRHLQLARSHAVKTGRDHVLCPSSNMTDCRGNAHWEQGYILFQDSDSDGNRSPSESLLQVSKPMGNIGIAMQSTSGRKAVIYRADGHSAGSNLTLTFCDPENDIAPKAVIVSNTGRARVSTTRWDGTPLNCPP
ncbi:MAG: GspH/FimT family protein [Candidatus Thiodiazotropha sp.]